MRDSLMPDWNVTWMRWPELERNTLNMSRTELKNTESNWIRNRKLNQNENRKSNQVEDGESNPTGIGDSNQVGNSGKRGTDYANERASGGYPTDIDAATEWLWRLRRWWSAGTVEVAYHRTGTCLDRIPCNGAEEAGTWGSSSYRQIGEWECSGCLVL